ELLAAAGDAMAMVRPSAAARPVMSVTERFVRTSSSVGWEGPPPAGGSPASGGGSVGAAFTYPSVTGGKSLGHRREPVHTRQSPAPHSAGHTSRDKDPRISPPPRLTHPDVT